MTHHKIIFAVLALTLCAAAVHGQNAAVPASGRAVTVSTLLMEAAACPAEAAACPAGASARPAEASAHAEPAAGRALLFTDQTDDPTELVESISRATRLEVSVTDILAGQRLVGDTVEARLIADALATVPFRPEVVFLRLGCNDSVAAAPCGLERAVAALYDRRTAHVTAADGSRERTVRVAVTRPNPDCAVAAGALWHAVGAVRAAFADTRVVLLATADSLRDARLAQAAALLSVPVVGDVERELEPFAALFGEGRRPQLGTVLVLGDSYSAQGHWLAALDTLASVRVTNLAVTSATIRDQADVRSVPYRVRPVRSDCSPNHNTLGCQLAHLEALRADTLRQLRPDIILLQGGANDQPDADSVVARYAESATLARTTNFAGALSALVRRLGTLYPSARIVAVTPSGLYYGHTDRPEAYLQKSAQIRAAARLLHIETIDWDLCGSLSYAFNNPAHTGDGSAARPYLYNVATAETIDLLHPNPRAARRLAEAALLTLIGRR